MARVVVAAAGEVREGVAAWVGLSGVWAVISAGMAREAARAVRASVGAAGLAAD